MNCESICDFGLKSVRLCDRCEIFKNFANMIEQELQIDEKGFQKQEK